MAGTPPLTRPSRIFGGATGLHTFTPALRRVQWSPKFKPEMPPRYDGVADLAGFLQSYEEAVWAAGWDDKVMTK